MMDLEEAINNYLEVKSDKTSADCIEFLIKLWYSNNIKTSEKYGIILGYFTSHLLSRVIEDGKCYGEIKSFFQLNYPVHVVNPKVKKEFVQSLITVMDESSNVNLIDVCLEITSNESFKDYLRANLKLYCKLMFSMIENFRRAIEKGQQNDEILSRIISENYCFARIDEFKSLFLDLLMIALSEVSKLSSRANEQAMLELVHTIFFFNPTLTGSKLEVFTRSLSQEQKFVLTEAFIVKSEHDEIGKLLTLINENQNNDEFLAHIKSIFGLLQTHDIDLAPVKKQQPELFIQLAERVHIVVESLRRSTDFPEFVETLSSFISYDAFLFDKNIYQILMDCMMREKSPSELGHYETLLSNVLMIYGQDMNQFIKKLLKSIEEKLETFTIPKKRKRKISSTSEAEGTPKKQKTVTAEHGEWNYIAHIWPTSTAGQFAELVAALNVAQTVKVWKQLDIFLSSVLIHIKETSEINENILFKIDFASNLLCEIFNSTRLHEQIMNKKKEIALAVGGFNKTQHLFYEVILNIEYNSRVMFSFLKLSYNYENFLALFIYHYSPEVSGELDSVFVDDQIRLKDEWKIIQQRIKNFGKNEERNQLNAVMIQHRQKHQLFSKCVTSNNEELLSMLNDDRQIDYLLRKATTRSFVISALKPKELKYFAQYLTKLEDEEICSTVISMVASDQALLDGIIAELVQHDFQSGLKILHRLPLDCASDDNKKKVFEKLLQQNQSEDLLPIIETTICKLFKNDSYKIFFKDFAMNEVVKMFELKRFSKIYYPMLSCAARKINVETLQNFNWILKTNDGTLQVLAQVISEVPMTPASGINAEAISTMKVDLISKMMESFAEKDLKKFSEKKCKEFQVLAKMCSENHAVLKDDFKAAYIKLLQSVVKIIVKLPNAESVKLLMMTLKDAKKFSFNDELKETIAAALLVYLKSTLEQRMSSETDDYHEVVLEKQLFEALRPIKTNFQEGCVQVLRQILAKNLNFTNEQLVYSFKIYQLAFSNVDKSSASVIKSYTKFLDDYSSRALTSNFAELMIQVLETNNVILADNKFQLDNTTVDEVLCLLIDPRVKPSEFSIDNFCKFYGAVGETLFVIANVRQNYFKSRISQYFNIYQCFMQEVYFFKNDQPDADISPIEISLLLKLTLQLENIMKMIVKHHSISIKVISLYILASIVNIFVKNPKTLSVGYKFKVNIKNICYQLMSTIDDKTRKHIYSVVDETTRNVYDGLFNEVRRN